ncbi:hypothetical protein L6164_018730 [Bauhinia variegata]|uniref:Uncharacterized protein n=1 Tax=Bauhinia variegata TaxID=167791 RepID=A0ACB9NDC7_BAUVA|nr:hypothetical protein L6164_018730 [Bauhinia variegata]
MNRLVRNATLSFSRRYRYETLGHHGKETVVKSTSYRRRRAQQRRVFLTTYKLPSVKRFQDPKPRKLKKAVCKVKKIVASVLICMRCVSFKFRSRKTAASPGPKRKSV